MTDPCQDLTISSYALSNMTYTIGNSDETMSITPLATINNDDICVCTITPIINDVGLSAVLTFDGKTAPNSQTFTLA